MSALDENYFLRKCYFKREQVPTQTVMKNKMLALADVYFKSMTPKLKVLAGLEPPMKGGGSDWYVPPADVLKGRAVMKPCKKEYLSKLGFKGIDEYTEKFVADHKKQMDIEQVETLMKNDINWMNSITRDCRNLWDDTSKELSKLNTEKTLQAFSEFQNLYTTSITNIESIVFEATAKEINRVKDETYQYMQARYETMLKHQAKMIYDRLTNRLMTDKAAKKKKFMEKVEEANIVRAEVAHDINLDKHLAIEKVRHLLACQSLACQVYVALKEQEKHEKEIKEMVHEHKKKITKLKEEINWKSYEIKLIKQKEEARGEFNRIWQRKVCRIVKTFQEFVSYCLRNMPEQAEFFINMERLMMIQMSEVVEEPDTTSMFESEEEEPEMYQGPMPHTRPFVVCGDFGVKPQYDDALCPSKRGSNLSHLPVVCVNKRYIYTACDNLQQFVDKIDHYRTRVEDVQDDHDYEYSIPAAHSESQDLREIKFQGSLMRVLQDEFPNTNQVKLACNLCKLPFCLCTAPRLILEHTIPVQPPTSPDNTKTAATFKTHLSRKTELKHEREPKLESYFQYIMPKCRCPKTAKKHLYENLPAYMRNTSKYAAPELPDYEPCGVETLKYLVEKARNRPKSPVLQKVASKTREIATQYSDVEFDAVCNCLSEQELVKLYKELSAYDKGTEDAGKRRRDYLTQSQLSTTSYLDKSAHTFSVNRARSLRRLAEDSQIEEIFKRTDCSYWTE